VELAAKVELAAALNTTIYLQVTLTLDVTSDGANNIGTRVLAFNSRVQGSNCESPCSRGPRTQAGASTEVCTSVDWIRLRDHSLPMKWLLCFALLLAGCSDSPPPSAGGGSNLPGVGPGTGGAGGAGGAGGTGGVGGAPRGACDNAKDIDAAEAAGVSLREVASSCGSLANVSTFCDNFKFNAEQYEECVSDCVEDEVPGLSIECASCYGALERCGLVQFPSCRISCQQNLCSTLCLNCLNDAGCLEEYEDCRGLPGDGCPG